MATAEELKDFVKNLDQFATRGHAEKIRVFAWLQDFLFKRERFSTGDINWCYDTLKLRKSNTSQYLKDMEGKDLLKDKRGYYCEAAFTARYDALYGEHEITINVRKMVKDLINVLPELGEKDIMREAIICLRHNAGRAAIVMVWNIAFYHLCQYVLQHKLSDFNNRLPVRYSRKWKITDLPVIIKYEDFGEQMSEREVLEVCNSAGIITGDMFKIYVEKLGKRNSAAHPSAIHITQVQAEGFIDDLIRNTVLKLTI